MRELVQDFPTNVKSPQKVGLTDMISNQVARTTQSIHLYKAITPVDIALGQYIPPNPTTMPSTTIRMSIPVYPIIQPPTVHGSSQQRSIGRHRSSWNVESASGKRQAAGDHLSFTFTRDSSLVAPSLAARREIGIFKSQRDLEASMVPIRQPSVENGQVKRLQTRSPLQMRLRR
jgi:hypothetical protein